VIKFRQLMKATKMLRAGRFGDGAILKADALGAGATPEALARLDGVRGYLPPIDLEALDQLPEGSFGRAYARHMKEHGLRPFEVSPQFDPEILRRNVFAVRYAVTHDIFHLLLGFDTTLPGEMGVLAFAAAQGYSRSQTVSLGFALILYSAMAPRQMRQTWRCLKQPERAPPQASRGRQRHPRERRLGGVPI
jgi:ubiquinone biosynthesis protein COQ4